MLANKIKPTNKIRGLVSKKKRRFQEGGFDLDLSYITDRIIAMGFPSERLEGLYRNPMHEVQRFLESLHGDHYKVYNLCSERRYDHKKFHGRVYEFPFDDHNPCPLGDIPRFCKNVGDWLDEHPQNVAVIHCKAGKGRTGTLICCFLMWLGLTRTASEAMQFFAAKRTKNNKGVTLHSQRRYIRYYESVLQQGMPGEKILKLQRIRMHTVPNFNKKQGGSEPWFSISRGTGATIYYSDPVKGKKGNQVLDFDCGNIRLVNDIKIEFYHKNLKGKMFFFWFHCSFINDYYFCLRKRELEHASKDKACKHFAPGFKVELFFTDDNMCQVPNKGDVVNEHAGSSTCCGCQQEIASSDASVMLSAGVFHWECLVCGKCGKSFTGARNCIIKDGQATCERCDGDDFFTRCTACFRPLTDHKMIEIGENAWHQDCFRCFYCSKILDRKNEEDCVMHGGKPYCCEHEGMVPGHNACANPNCHVGGGQDNMLRALGKHWHRACFACTDCGRVLDHQEDEFFDMDGAPCCSSHEDPISCFSCSLPIVPSKDGLSVLGEVWHPACFACAEVGCGLKFSPADAEDVEIKQGRAVCKSHGMRTCVACNDRISDPATELVVVGERDWHAACFRCVTCSKPVDASSSTYFMTDFLPCCKAHQRKCARCQLEVIAMDLVQAEGLDWHKGCFVCDMEGCGKALKPMEYVVQNGASYCSHHPICTNCETPIADNDLHHDENGHFHTNCYRCNGCNVVLDPLYSAFHGRRILCANCHPAPQCDFCGQILAEGHIAVLNRRYHERCLVCYQCHSPFASVNESVAVTPDGKPVCKACNSIPCTKCGLGIEDEVVEALGNSYHPECFTCNQCQSPLLKSFGVLNEQFLCTNCLDSQQYPPCSACSKPLTGKYTAAGGQKFHFECFKCSHCSCAIGGGSGNYFSNGSAFFCGKCADDPAITGGMQVPRVNSLSANSAQAPGSAPVLHATHRSSTKMQSLPDSGAEPAASLDAITHEGFMKKQGGRFKTWRKRWFILKGSTLTYAVTKQDTPIGTIILSSKCSTKKDSSKKFYMELATPGRTWRFVAETGSDLDHWYEAITAAVR